MATIRISIDLPVAAPSAFDRMVDELTAALNRVGLRLERGESGFVARGESIIGRIGSWQPGRRILLRWQANDWNGGDEAEIELRVEALSGGSEVILELRGWGRILEDGSSDLEGWFCSEVVAQILQSATPAALGDWVTDRRARRPWGPGSGAVYGDPLYHYPNFRVMLSELALTADDFLLEIGCGGGALLREALKSGCRAAAIDHSTDMVALAREANQEAIEAGRLQIVVGSAERLPYRDQTFTCAAMTGVLGFLDDPVLALSEIRRVLVPGGRFVSLGSDPELRGTPGAPEPMASRLRFYDDAELAQLGREGGFEDVAVVRRDLEPHARAVGVPEEVLPLFAGEGARFLICRRR